MGSCKLMFDKNDSKSKSRTQQQFAKESDINNIISRYRKTGILPTVDRAMVFGDFATITDFATLNNKFIAAQEMFMTLPGRVRDKFKGDVSELIQFINDPKNLAEARELGLVLPASKEEIEDIQKAEKEAAAGKPAAGQSAQ